MLKISVIETRRQRKLVVEGELIFPWASELRNACSNSAAGLGHREVVVELQDVTAISQEGENILGELITQGVKFRSSGLFTRYVLKQLARRARRQLQQSKK